MFLFYSFVLCHSRCQSPFCTLVPYLSTWPTLDFAMFNNIPRATIMLFQIDLCSITVEPSCKHRPAAFERADESISFGNFLKMFLNVLCPPIRSHLPASQHPSINGGNVQAILHSDMHFFNYVPDVHQHSIRSRVEQLTFIANIIP